MPDFQDNNKFVAYPRASAPGTYGSIERLEALGDFLFGGSGVVAVWFALPFLSALWVAADSPACYAVTSLILGKSLAEYFSKLARGMGWNTLVVVVPACALAVALPVAVWLTRGNGLNNLYFLVYYGVLILATKTAVNELRRYGVFLTKGINNRIAAFQESLLNRRIREGMAAKGVALHDIPANLYSGEPPKA